jgi:hypothetical protein
MRTSKRILGSTNERTNLSATSRRSLITGLALATLVIAGGVANPTHAGTSSAPPVAECSDFACEK